MLNLKIYFIILIFIVFIGLVKSVLGQGVSKEMNVGYIKWKIVDSVDEGDGSFGWGATKAWDDGYRSALFQTKTVKMGCQNWTDTLGFVHPVKISGHGQWETDDIHIMMPVPDSQGRTINRYYRQQPPNIVVDGFNLHEVFPQDNADHINPSKLPGTADGLIESIINSDMGVSIHHRAIGFAQKNHNKYLIREYIFKNTGNVDLDEDIELPNQSISNFYFLKQLRLRESPLKPWPSSIGQYQGDELRLCYGYSARDTRYDEDAFGGSIISNDNWGGQLLCTTFYGEQIIFASQSSDDFNTDDINQPGMTGYFDVDFPSFTFHPNNSTTSQNSVLYQVMQEGAVNLEGIYWPELNNTKPGTHHGIPLDQRGFNNPSEMEGYGWSASVVYSVGPYELSFGDSIKVVIAEVYGSISPEKSYEIGTAWENNEATWGDNTPGGDTEILPPQYQDHPELYSSDDGRSEINNWAKDNWVYTSFDSLVQTAEAAKWAYENNYNVPQPPPSPSITVTSLSDRIRIQWGSESESASDFAGYRVYRTHSDWYPHATEYGNFVGTWEKIYECGAGTGNPLTNQFDDVSTYRGFAYYYAVTAFDDGSSNGVDFHGRQESLESSILHTMTKVPAILIAPGSVEEKDVVATLTFSLKQNYPNPFNPTTKIEFSLPKSEVVFLKVFDVRGKELATLLEERYSAGRYSYEWQAENYPSGVYFYQIQAGKYQNTKKMLLVR